jgi:signal peptidase II
MSLLPESPSAGSAAPRPQTGRPIAQCLIALAVLTAADLGTKQWAREALSVPSAAGHAPPVCAPDADGHRYNQRRPVRAMVLIEGHLQLTYAENCGGAFGVLHSAPRWVRAGIFTVSALGFMGLLLWMFIRGGGGRMFVIAVPLIASGALGNLVDRIRYGYVIDFIRYHGLFEWPTFNVADIAIAVGAVLLFLDGFGLRARSAETRAETAAT